MNKGTPMKRIRQNSACGEPIWARACGAVLLCLLLSGGLMAAQPATTGKFDKEVYAATDTVSVTPVPVANAAQLLWVDSYGRILKVFPTDKPITIKLDAPTSRFNFIVAVDKDGKTLAESPFLVTPDIPYWDDYEVWLYGGADKPRDFHYTHYRACNVSGSMAYPFGGKPEGFAVNNLRWYREWCVAKYQLHYGDQFSKGFWAKFMDAHRSGDFDSENKYFYRPHCLSDPKFIESCKQQMLSAVSLDAKYRHGAYSISDEASVTSFCSPFDYCFRPETMQAMRLWLKAKYKTLDALNQEWATDFKDWDAVTPLTTNETFERNNPKFRELLRTRVGGVQIRERNLLMDELVVPGHENHASWSDHREFMDTAYANILNVCTEAVREKDPHSPAGILGTQMPSAFGGFDFWKLAHAVDWFEAYDMGNSWELLTSWRTPRTVLSQTTFIGKIDKQRYQATSYMLKGCRGGIVYEPANAIRNGKVVSPVLAALRLTWGELRGGIAKLRFRCSDVPNPIGVYYNQASRRVSWLYDAETDGTTWPRRLSSWDAGRCSMNNGISGVMRAIQDNGYQFKVVAEQQAIAGELKKYKVLFLARIEAMSEAEAKAIGAFVEAGGILVTDGALGTFDPQCRRRDKGMLDELCGVKHVDFRYCERDGGYFMWNHSRMEKGPTAQVNKTWTLIPDGDALLKDVDLSLLFVSSPGLRATTGTPLARAGETSAFVVSHVGKGVVICSNIYWADYMEKRGNTKLGAPILNFVRNVLTQAEIKPNFELYERSGAEAKAAGKVPPLIQRYLFKEGNLQYVAFNAQGRINQQSDGSISISGIEPGSLVPLSVKLPSKSYVYNARTGEAYGETDLVPVELDTMGYVWLSLLPYKVSAVEVKRLDADKDPLLVKYQAAISASGTPGTHVLHLEVIDPEGNICDYLACNLVAEMGKVSGALRLSENGKAGTWTLRFRDAATGVTGDLAVVKAEGAFASSRPIHNAIQHGDLYGQIRGPTGFKQEGGQYVASMLVMVWSEGLRNPKGKVAFSVNAPWSLKTSEVDLAEQIAKLQGEFLVQVSCPDSTKLDATPLNLTAKVTCTDGRSLEIKGPAIEGKKLAQRLEKHAPISISFSSYYEDMNRLIITEPSLSHSLPYTIGYHGEDEPSGKVTFAVSEGWTIEPKELDLANVVLRQRGEGFLTVTGPIQFKDEPVVTITVTTSDGAIQKASQNIAISYAFYSKEAPTLDGKLDEACWQKARTVTQFHPEGSSDVAPYPTSFKVCYDDLNLYVAFQAGGIDPEKMKATKPTRADGKDEQVYGEESLELFLDPTQRAGKIPYQLIMNYLGKRQDMIGEDERWNGTWDVKGAKTTDGYILEIAIPFTTLNTQKPKANDIWAFNPYRDTVAPFKEFHGHWSVVGDGRASSFYGRLFFRP